MLPAERFKNSASGRGRMEYLDELRKNFICCLPIPAPCPLEDTDPTTSGASFLHHIHHLKFISSASRQGIL